MKVILPSSTLREGGLHKVSQQKNEKGRLSGICGGSRFLRDSTVHASICPRGSLPPPLTSQDPRHCGTLSIGLPEVWLLVGLMQSIQLRKQIGGEECFPNGERPVRPPERDACAKGQPFGRTWEEGTGGSSGID